MSCDEAKFQSYSWSYGTTSFRVSELKYKIERQLIRLKELWEEYPDKTWRELQDIYFDKLVEEGLAQPTASRRDKDARQKTSPLKDLGLVTEERRLTEVGEKLYKIIKNNDFNFDNVFQIRNDSFIYFKQFLKIEFSKNSNSRSYSNFKINPFLIIIYSILELGHLTEEEFTYLLPVCKTYDEVKALLSELRNIKKRENEEEFIEKFLENKIKSLPNYKAALSCLLEDPFNSENFAKSLMDRKSGRNTSSFFSFYEKVVKYYRNMEKYNLQKKIQELQSILVLLSNIKHKSRVYLKKFFFGKKNLRKLEKEHVKLFESRIQFECEEDLVIFLFYKFHIYRWIVNLEEYYDLNKRFLGLTDLIRFEDGKVYLDEIAYLYFETIREKMSLIFQNLLSSNEEEYWSRLQKDLEINEISYLLYVPENELFNLIAKKYPSVKSEIDIRKVIFKLKKDIKRKRFIDLIEEKFSNDNLKKLLIYIKDRKDEDILKYKNISWEADVPTIFEYLLGIIWYKLLDYQGDLTEFLNLYLDANLLPRRFASGNKADIIFKLKDEDILLEVTLTTRDNQRKMELEPISRHLGKYILQQSKGNTYAIFVAPYLDPNVLVVFRAYKSLKYYDSNNPSRYVRGLKIIPLSIDDLLVILDKNLNYDRLNKIFNEAYCDDEMDGYRWYEDILKEKIRCS